MYRRLIRRDPENEALRADLERIEGASGIEDDSAGASRAKEVLSRLEKWRRAIAASKEGHQGRKRQKMAVCIRIVGPSDEHGGETMGAVDGGEIDVWSDLEDDAAAGIVLDTRLCDSEEAVVENVSKLPETCGAVILDCRNVAVCGKAVKEVLSSVKIPVIEVYPANIYRKDPCVKPVISQAVTGQLVGFGDQGCAMAVRAAADMMADVHTTEGDARELSGLEETS